VVVRVVLSLNYTGGNILLEERAVCIFRVGLLAGIKILRGENC